MVYSQDQSSLVIKRLLHRILVIVYEISNPPDREGTTVPSPAILALLHFKVIRDSLVEVLRNMIPDTHVDGFYQHIMNQEPHIGVRDNGLDDVQSPDASSRHSRYTQSLPRLTSNVAPMGKTD